MSNNTSVTIVGSFRKNPDALRKLFESLTLKYTILSPVSIDWDNPEEEFVKVNTDTSKTISEIETRHLEAIRNSDLVVLFAPSGYVGVSGAFEVGFAYGLGIPILSSEKVSDQTIVSMIDGILDTTLPSIDYGRGLKAFQTQYSKISIQNGWDSESARDTMLLLMEEAGELARAVRQYEGLKREGEFYVQLGEELADVQIYIAHLANTVNIDLGDAVTAKILKNRQKKN